MKNKYRLTDYFMGMDKDDIVELNEKEADMLKNIIIRYYSEKEIHDIVRDRITDILKEIQKEYILYQIIKMTRVNEYIMDFEPLVEKK